jgi:serine kinase of HPr protein (carbohydrate metabolism regulator)
MAFTTHDLAALPEFNALVRGEKAPLEGVFCCDLLSLVISRAQDNCVWITVMGHVNTVAVATLRDLPAIVVAEDMPVDTEMVEAARREGIWIYTTALPVFKAALAIHEAISHAL